MRRTLSRNMKYFLWPLLGLILICGCDTVRYLAADRSDKEKREQLEIDRLEWEIKNAETRYQAGQIDRAAYNRIRRQNGLLPTD